MVTLYQLAADALFPHFQGKLEVAERIPAGLSTLDLATPALVIDDARGEFRYRIQILGTHHAGTQSWEWPWHRQGNWPAISLAAAAHVHRLGREYGIEELTLGIVRDEDAPPLACLLAAEYISKVRHVFDRDAGMGNRNYFSITLGSFQTPTAERMRAVIAQGAEEAPYLDHKRALSAYAIAAGLAFDEHVHRAQLTGPQGTVEITFHSDGRIKTVEVA